MKTPVAFYTTPVRDISEKILLDGKIGILCNQTAWEAKTGEYLFETFYK